jgi:hypothetical protein
MGLIGKILGSPRKKESGNEQYERVTGAKSTADAAYEHATEAKQTAASGTKAGSTISKWGDRISAGAKAAPGFMQNPKFQNFAKNAAYHSNNILGGGNGGFGNVDMVGLGGTAPAKKKTGKRKLAPAFYDPKTGKTYLARGVKKSRKKSKVKEGPREFNPW